MSTMSTSQMSDPDRNLAASFVALAEGDQLRTSFVGNASDGVNSIDRIETEPREEKSTPGNDDVDTDTVRATVESTPINEFTHLAKILSYAFPIEFPFGVTAKQLGSTGTVLKRVFTMEGLHTIIFY